MRVELVQNKLLQKLNVNFIKIYQGVSTLLVKQTISCEEE